MGPPKPLSFSPGRVASRPRIGLAALFARRAALRAVRRLRAAAVLGDSSQIGAPLLGRQLVERARRLLRITLDAGALELSHGSRESRVLSLQGGLRRTLQRFSEQGSPQQRRHDGPQEASALEASEKNEDPHEQQNSSQDDDRD